MEWIRQIQQQNLTATVKEDGVAVTVGVTAGLPYVSRVGKDGVDTRYFSINSIPPGPPGEALRVAAGVWFGSNGKLVWNQAVDGDRWDVELTYPGLNVIQYPDVTIHMLFPLVGDHGGVSTPISELQFPSSSETFDLTLLCSEDGKSLRYQTTQLQSRIQSVAVANVPDVSAIAQYLNHPYDGGTVGDLLQLHLGRIDKYNRSIHKTAKDLSFIHFNSLVSKLGEQVSGGVQEGIVLSDGNKMVKLVDPQFIEANQFHHCVRNCIKKRTFGSSFLKYVPTTWMSVVNNIHEAWQLDRNLVPNQVAILRDLYITAQQHEEFTGPNGENSLTAAAHNMTLVEFAYVTDVLIPDR